VDVLTLFTNTCELTNAAADYLTSFEIATKLPRGPDHDLITSVSSRGMCATKWCTPLSIESSVDTKLARHCLKESLTGASVAG
jgi:hypothetical protein